MKDRPSLSSRVIRGASARRCLLYLGIWLVCCLALLGCSVGASAPSASATPRSAGRTVYIRNHSGQDEFVFEPKSITIRRGTRVTWFNRSAQPHTVTSKARHPVFDSGTQKLIKPGQRYSFVFRHAGRFPYYCLLHPYMTAVVIVRP